MAKPLPVLRVDRLPRRCGHEDGFRILKGERDEWAARRRGKWQAKHCAACQRALEASQQQAAVERREQKRERKREEERALWGSLPDGITFTATYEAATATWRGAMDVPGLPSFISSGVSASRLLRTLLQQYRAQEQPT